MGKQFTIADLTHPAYDRSLADWQKWRDTYESGSWFIEKYLEKFTAREDDNDFKRRKRITYNPAFAKAAVDEIKNSIFQRLVDIVRIGGSKSYQEAVKGKLGGVDLLGSSMNSFLGRKVLPELLSMARVGVFVDMPELSGITLAENQGKRPYLYTYKTEDIRTWRFDEYDCQSEYSSILLRDYVLEYDAELNMPIGETVRYRHLWVEDGRVHCRFYGNEGIPQGGNESYLTPGNPVGPEQPPPIVLNIDRIPFVVIEISASLLTDVAPYQIALLNMASSDLNYVLQSNFPFYTEQFEPNRATQYTRPEGSGTAADAGDAAAKEIKVGTSRGRRYPKGLDRPMFIAPPSDPLKTSMEKQEQMKAEIRQLVHLAVANLQPRDASAESKGMDNEGLESGLSYIGLELEHAERRIADYWAMYEGAAVPTVNYPEKYSLRSESDRREEATGLAELLQTVPSESYRKEVCKRLAQVLLGNKVSTESMTKIAKEIDAAQGVTAEVDVIAKHVEIGILDLELAAKLCGYPEGTVAKATKDHTDRLTRIAESQAEKSNTVAPGARGVGDLADNPAAGGKAEKAASRDTTTDPVAKDKTRGEAK